MFSVQEYLGMIQSSNTRAQFAVPRSVNTTVQQPLMRDIKRELQKAAQNPVGIHMNLAQN